MTAKEKPDVVFLMETKNFEVKLQRIQSTLHFQHSYILNPYGLAGGLSGLWNDQVSIEVARSSQHMLDMTCRIIQEDITFRLICIHAPSNYHHRQVFWDELRMISRMNHFPWICAGDFNDFLYP